MNIAILGWGSLLWDERPAFDKHHGDWQSDGPELKLEFSRISSSRNGALTIVLDHANGNPCRVAYALSKRKNPDDAICDLRSREGTVLKSIGFYFADGARPPQYRDGEALMSIQHWSSGNGMDVVIWTDLEGNFAEKSVGGRRFSVENGISYLQALNVSDKAKAAEYIWRAPEFIDTPLRRALQSEPWFRDCSQRRIS